MAEQISLLDALSEQPRALSVTELTSRIKALVESRFAEVWVEGEVSNFKRQSSGHWYFTLKDSGAQVRCASFRGSNRYIRFQPADGLAVRARGHLSVYEPRGEYQLIVTALEPVGRGGLQMAFEQLKARLEAEGLFRAARKRPLPLLPRRVGLVTSPSGAALRDMLRILKRRNRGVAVFISPTRVQGEGAGFEVARAIRRLSAMGQVDVIIIGRGGGSLEDLWAFNEEAVARAIVACRVPVISAVGHETDFTIADFVADVRAPTPSAAAEIVAAAEGELRATLNRLRHAAVQSARYRVLHARDTARQLRHSQEMRAVPGMLHKYIQATGEAHDELLDRLRLRLRAGHVQVRDASTWVAASDPRRRLANLRAEIAAAVAETTASARLAINERRELSARTVGTLASLNPLEVLSRGYAIVRDESGRVVRSPGEVEPSGIVSIRVEQGEFKARKEEG